MCASSSSSSSFKASHHPARVKYEGQYVVENYPCISWAIPLFNGMIAFSQNISSSWQPSEVWVCKWKHLLVIPYPISVCLFVCVWGIIPHNHLMTRWALSRLVCVQVEALLGVNLSLSVCVCVLCLCLRNKSKQPSDDETSKQMCKWGHHLVTSYLPPSPTKIHNRLAIILPPKFTVAHYCKSIAIMHTLLLKYCTPIQSFKLYSAMWYNSLCNSMHRVREELQWG